MRRWLARSLCSLAVVASVAGSAHAWSLAEHIDSVLTYDAETMEEFSYAPGTIRGRISGRLMVTATRDEQANLVPYLDGMQVEGELREGQMLLTPDTRVTGAWAEFVVRGGTQLQLAYGLCDNSRERGTEGTRLDIQIVSEGEVVAEQQVRLDENRWMTGTIELARGRPRPPGECLVRMLVHFIGFAGANWSALVIEGDGEVGTREQARALSPKRDEIRPQDLTLRPSDLRVTARPGYDNLFLDGKPYPSYAAKGHQAGSQSLQKQVGINLYYVEGASFVRYWSEEDEEAGVVVPQDSGVHAGLQMCQRAGLPYKTALSMAHCVPFLPEWMVAKYDLGLEGHQMRRGGETHASFIKPRTLELHKRGLEGWVKPWTDQPAIFVFGQEDDIAGWDDQSEEAKASWRDWLRQRFEGDFADFAGYVGGVQGADDFGQAPYPEHLNDHEAYGYPRRASYLKLMWQTEAYAQYLGAARDHVAGLAPGIPLTQRYVAAPSGRAISKMVGFDYNYCFGHLTEEGVAGNYGVGKKIWTGVYGHFGVLPFPRGGSIGKTVDREVRRAQMTEEEWELNAFTLLANGCRGYEVAPFFEVWGEPWVRGALYDNDLQMTENGRNSRKVMERVLALAPYLEHYDRYEDVAVFHDEAFQTRSPLGMGLSQSKVGIYTLIRELGYHADPLTTWDMTADNLAGKRVLILAGTIPIAPEVQEAIREYVRAGGTLIAVYCAQGKGFPGCNSYEFQGPVGECATECSFDNPPAQAHLGDVLGIVEGGGSARHLTATTGGWTVELTGLNELVEEGKWVDREACCAALVPADEAGVIGTFEDGTAAAVSNRFGEGMAITVGVDCGLIASNVTPQPFYEGVDALLASRGCRKVYDTGDYHVEAGMWHNDAGQRLLILVNHDPDKAHTVKLPDGQEVSIEPWRAHTWTSD